MARSRTAAPCDVSETLRVVRHVVDEARLACAVRKDESLERMAHLGVMKTPAVVFDGSVVLSGRIPKAEEVRRLRTCDAVVQTVRG